MTDPNTETSDPIHSTVDELRNLIREAEEALAAGTTATEEIEELRERLRGAVAEGQNLVANFADTVKRQARRADDAIRSNPYQTAAIAVGLGIIGGLLLSRRSSAD